MGDTLTKKKDDPIIGYQYKLGMHLVLAHGPIDAVLAMRWQDKLGWEGVVGGGRINVAEPTLFGGQKREGGVGGRVDFLPGGASQGVNSYLSRKLSGAIPAFRGVASLVLRQFYWGNNPYIKPMAVKATNIHGHQDNWLPAKAAINPRWEIQGSAIWIALDGSGSMSGTPFGYQKEAVAQFIEGLAGSPNSVKVVVWGETIQDSAERIEATDADYASLASWCRSLSNTRTQRTEYDVAFTGANDWFTEHAPDNATWEPTSGGLFGASDETDEGPVDGEREKRRIVIFTTDGQPIPTSTADDAVTARNEISDVEVFCFNIDDEDTTYTELLDNTSSDGVPVIENGDPSALLDVMAGAFKTWVDMNPAHILRTILISPLSSGTGSTDLIGTSFEDAANTLYDEGFGLSFFWANPNALASFKEKVERHIDGVVYMDRITGKWELKLIRADYDAGTLTKFGRAEVAEWINVSRPMQHEIPNQITIVFSRRKDGKESSVTVTNVAAVQMLGRVVNKKVTYEGCYDATLASNIALRDLKAMTLPLLSGAIRLGSLPATINLGDAIKIENTDLGINETIVRVTEIEDSDGREASAVVRFVEDKFAFDYSNLVVSVSDPEDDDEGAFDAVKNTIRLVEEAPYYVLVRRLGQSNVDSELTSNEDAGYVHATAVRPADNHIGMTMATQDDGQTTWSNAGTASYCPAGTLQEAISARADDTSLLIDLSTALGNVSEGSLAVIGDEVVRVDNMAMSGSDVEVTIGRGCLDTVPEAHKAGDTILFFQGFMGTNGTRYLATETVDVKLLDQTPKDMISLNAADTETVIFDSRAVRPYPVGNLKSGDGYFPDSGDAPWSTPIPVSWAHRDRTIQTAAAVNDFADGNIGPETDVAYYLSVWSIVGKDDFFAGSDFFSGDDFFTDDTPVQVLPERSMGQGTVAGFDFLTTSTTVDFFDLGPDFFAIGDFFGVSGILDFFSVTDVFDTDEYPDFFATVIGRAQMAEFRVRTERDGYENWQTAKSRVRVAHAPDLEAEAI